MLQPTVIDAAILRRYRQDLTVLKFLFGLSPSLRSQVLDQILRGDTIPTLTSTFFRVMRVFTGADVISALSIEQSTMASGHGRDHGRGCECDFVGGRGSYVDRKTIGDKGPKQCKHCRRNNHISEKCWEKFGRREWAQLIDTDTSPS